MFLLFNISDKKMAKILIFTLNLIILLIKKKIKIKYTKISICAEGILYIYKN